MVVDKTVLITGGSGGIGFTISQYFAKAGYRVLWVSLKEEEINTSRDKLLQEIPECKIFALTQDLSQVGASKKVYDWVKKNHWQVDVLINNAAIGSYGFVNDIDINRDLNMIHLNLMSLYEMTRYFLKDMTDRNDGTIINISSNTSFQPTPKLSVYGATKAFVNHLSRSINEELKIQNSNVKVMCVCPAAIKNTNFKVAGNMQNLKAFSGLATTTSEEVAKDVWDGFRKGKDFIISGRRMRILYRFSGIIPYRIQQFIVRKEINE